MSTLIAADARREVLTEFACALLRTSCKTTPYDLAFPDKSDFVNEATQAMSIKRAALSLKHCKAKIPPAVLAMAANSIHDIEYFALNVQPLAVKSYCRALTDTRSAPSRAKKQRTKLDTEDSSSGDNSNTESSDMSGANAGSKKAKKKA